MGDEILQGFPLVQERLLGEACLVDFIGDSRNKECSKSIYEKDSRFKKALDKASEENREMAKLVQQPRAELARTTLRSDDSFKDLFCRKADITDLYYVVMSEKSFLERPIVIKRIAGSYLLGDFLADPRNCNYVTRVLEQISEDQLWYAVQGNEKLFAPLIRERYAELKKTLAYDCLELNDVRSINTVEDLIGVYPYLRKTSPLVHAKILEAIEAFSQEDIDRLASHLTFEHLGLFCKQIEKKLQSSALRARHAHRLQNIAESVLFKKIVSPQLQKDIVAIIKKPLEIGSSTSQSQVVSTKNDQNKVTDAQSWRSSLQQFAESSRGRELSKAFVRSFSKVGKPMQFAESGFAESIIANPMVRGGFGAVFGWPAAGAFVINDMLVLYSKSLLQNSQEGQSYFSNYLLSTVLSVVGGGLLKGASAVIVSIGEEMTPLVAAIKLTSSAHQGLQTLKHIKSISDRVSEAMQQNDFALGALALSELGLYKNYLKTSSDRMNRMVPYEKKATAKIQIVSIFEKLDSRDEERLKEIPNKKGLKIRSLPDRNGLSLETEITLDEPLLSLEAAKPLFPSWLQYWHLKTPNEDREIKPVEQTVLTTTRSGQVVAYTPRFPECSKTLPPEEPKKMQVICLVPGCTCKQTGLEVDVVTPVDPRNHCPNRPVEEVQSHFTNAPVIPTNQVNQLYIAHSSDLRYQGDSDHFRVTFTFGSGSHRTRPGGPIATPYQNSLVGSSRESNIELDDEERVYIQTVANAIAASNSRSGDFWIPSEGFSGFTVTSWDRNEAFNGTFDQLMIPEFQDLCKRIPGLADSLSTCKYATKMYQDEFRNLMRGFGFDEYVSSAQMLSTMAGVDPRVKDMDAKLNSLTRYIRWRQQEYPAQLLCNVKIWQETLTFLASHRNTGLKPFVGERAKHIFSLMREGKPDEAKQAFEITKRNVQIYERFGLPADTIELAANFWNMNSNDLNAPYSGPQEQALRDFVQALHAEKLNLENDPYWSFRAEETERLLHNAPAARKECMNLMFGCINELIKNNQPKIARELLSNIQFSRQFMKGFLSELSRVCGQKLRCFLSQDMYSLAATLISSSAFMKLSQVSPVLTGVYVFGAGISHIYQKAPDLLTHCAEVWESFVKDRPQSSGINAARLVTDSLEMGVAARGALDLWKGKNSLGDSFKAVYHGIRDGKRIPVGKKLAQEGLRCLEDYKSELAKLPEATKEAFYKNVEVLKDLPDLLKKEGPLGKTLSAIEQGYKQVKGYLYEIDVAARLKKTEKILGLSEKINGKEIDIRTATKLIECKAWDSSQFAGERLQGLKSQLGELKELAQKMTLEQKFGCDVVFYSKNSIPLELVQWLNAKGIEYVEG